MKKILFCIGLVILSLTGVAQEAADKKSILAILDKQLVAWNKGNLEEFMVGYWNNDSLAFIGKNGVTYGYKNTLENYKKNYNGEAEMGKLFFDILSVKKISADTYFVIGKWFLKRSAGDVGGHYSLLFKKVKGLWVIVADHSS